MTHRDRKRIIAGTWGALAIIVTGISVISIRKELPETGFSEALYTTIRMFVFERDLENFPKSPTLVVAHFIAPMITFSALGMIITYLLRSSPSLRARLVSKHIVVCSLDRTGKLLCTSLKKLGIRVVGIENQNIEPLLDWTQDHGVILLQKDPQSLSSLQLVAYKRAQAIIFANEDDLINLDEAFRAGAFLDERNASTNIVVWAHVADNRLKENMLAALHSQPLGRVRLFDAFHIAARQMLKTHFPHDRREGVLRITIVGLGSFGQDILEELVLGLAPEESPALRIIDTRDIAADVRRITNHLGGYVNISSYCGDLCEFADHEKSQDEVYFLCADDDHGNLTAALSLAKRATGSQIFVRMRHWPMTGVVGHFGSDMGIVFINVDALVSEGLSDTFDLRK